MAPKLILLMSSGSKKKEPRYTRLSEANAPHSQRMCAKVSSFTPRLLHKGLSSSPNRWRCLLSVLCPVTRPVITLDWALFKDKNLALAARLGPEINSRACLWVPSRPHHLAQSWLINQWLSLLSILCLQTPRAGSGPRNPRTEPFLTSSSAISFPHIPALVIDVWMSEEHWWNDTEGGKLKHSKQTLSQHLFLHQSHNDCPGMKHGSLSPQTDMQLTT